MDIDNLGELSYEQTVELEKNIAIKNEAVKLYEKFMCNIKLPVSGFDSRHMRFKTWDDGNNQTYISINENGNFVYQCRFLHESYDVEVTLDNIFRLIKSDYRGIDHLRSDVANPRP